MRPLLFEIYGLRFPSWGVFFALGFIAAFTWGYLEARREGVDAEMVLDIGFWLSVGAILGARILYVIVEWKFFRENLWEAFRIWNGGMVLYGGAIGGFAAAYIAMIIMRSPRGKMADIGAQSAALGLIFGRIGCLLNGCCYGRPAKDLPWAIVFTRTDSMANMHLGIPLYPTQIYEIFFLFVIFVSLVLLARRKRFDWQVFWTFLILYPLARFTVEIYRGDPRGWVEEPILSRALAPMLRGQTFSDYRGGFSHAPYLSTSQFISVLTLVVSVMGYLLTSRAAFGRGDIYVAPTSDVLIPREGQGGRGNLLSSKERDTN